MEIRPLTREEQLETMIGIIESEIWQMKLTLSMLKHEQETIKQNDKNLIRERKIKND